MTDLTDWHADDGTGRCKLVAELGLSVRLRAMFGGDFVDYGQGLGYYA